MRHFYTFLFRTVSSNLSNQAPQDCSIKVLTNILKETSDVFGGYLQALVLDMKDDLLCTWFESRLFAPASINTASSNGFFAQWFCKPARLCRGLRIWILKSLDQRKMIISKPRTFSKNWAQIVSLPQDMDESNKAAIEAILVESETEMVGIKGAFKKKIRSEDYQNAIKMLQVLIADTVKKMKTFEEPGSQYCQQE